jgi:hypothetical protein
MKYLVLVPIAVILLLFAVAVLIACAISMTYRPHINPFTNRRWGVVWNSWENQA